MSDQQQNTKDSSLSELVPHEQIELFRQFIQVQGDELEVRREEMGLSRQQQADGHEYAKLMLKAQAEELRHNRQSFYDDRKKQYALFGGIFICLVRKIRGQFSARVKLQVHDTRQSQPHDRFENRTLFW